MNFGKKGVDVFKIRKLPGEILVPGTFLTESISSEDADNLSFQKWNFIDTIRLEEGHLVGSDVATTLFMYT